MTGPLRRRLEGWTLVAIVASTAVAAGPAARARPAPLPPASASTVVVALSAMPRGTDPLVTTDQYSADVQALIYDPLYYETPDGSYASDVALSWRSGDGGRTYTYTLDPRARWTDGRRVDARDVKRSLVAYASAADKGRERGALRELRSVRVLGPGRVRVTLRRPDPAWPGVVADLPILPAGRGTAAAGAVQAVTDGPYRVRRWDASGGSISLVANRAYFRGAPHVARIDIRVLPTSAAALSALRRGSVQVAMLPPAWAARVARTPGLASHVVDTMGMALVAFQCARTPFRQAGVRRALALAVNRPALLRAADPAAVMAVGPWPAAFDGGSAKGPGYDPARARRLLARAGWRPGPGGVRRRAGRVLAFRLRYPDGSPALRRAAAFLARSWRAVGVRARLVGESPASLGERAATGRYQSLVTAAWFGTGAGLTGLLGGARDYPPTGQDIARYASARVTRLLAAGAARLSAEASPPPATLATLASLLDRAPPYLPLWSDRGLVVTDARMTGFVASPVGPDLYEPQRWILP